MTSGEDFRCDDVPVFFPIRRAQEEAEIVVRLFDQEKLGSSHLVHSRHLRSAGGVGSRKAQQ